MNSLSSRNTAILVAVSTAIFVAAGTLLPLVVRHATPVILAIILSLCVFIVTYMFTIYILERFILEKINPIYRIMHSVNVSREDLSEEFGHNDIMTTVKNDVMEWAKKKTVEISQLRRSEKYRRDYIGNVSHELKTPIFNMQGYVSTLLEGGLEDPSVNRLYLERTEKSINRLISIVNDLESISRLESGELLLDIKKTDIIKLFEESFEMHEMMAAERGIKLRFARKLDKPVYVLADRQRIFEAINNLVVNSIKYGKTNGATTVDFLGMDENLLIEISDNGIGIEEKEIPRIFERFYRIDKSRSRELGGTGLGLAIVKHIIEAHRQTLNVRSLFGEGSTFAFTLKKA